MMRNNDISGYRILVVAITISLAWHILWLSTIKIVVAPGCSGPVKFSKVSFLGPILTRVGEVRATPAASSFLEKRYLSAVGNMPHRIERPQDNSYFKYEPKRVSYPMIDGALPSVIDEVVGVPKLEPVSSSDYE